jgi:hypothetical protein
MSSGLMDLLKKAKEKLLNAPKMPSLSPNAPSILTEEEGPMNNPIISTSPMISSKELVKGLPFESYGTSMGGSGAGQSVRPRYINEG